MSIHIFCGPSLPARAVLECLPNAVMHGPAARGDVYLAVEAGASSIGLIDGYFDQSLSVWHKEVLWALCRGVAVYGAASMGALRGAELRQYGMIGVGWVFEQFASGLLEDDDEVALVHAPAEAGYRAQSEAMVNLRATLTAARRAGVVDELAEHRLVQGLKRLFYPYRSVEALQRLASEEPSVDAQGLRAFLERHGVVNQKRADALELVQRLAAGPLPASTANFRFADTDAWRTLRAKLAQRTTSRAPAPNVATPASAGSQAPADPLTWLHRFYPELYAHVVGVAARRALAQLLAQVEGSSVAAAEVQAESESFRRQRRLLTPDDTDKWLSEHGLDRAGFSRIAADNVLYNRFLKRVDALVFAQIPDTLRILGVFDEGPGSSGSSPNYDLLIDPEQR